MAFPRIILFVVIMTLLILAYPFYCFYQTVKFHYKQFKISKYYKYILIRMRLFLILLFPLFYLGELLFFCPKKLVYKIQKLR